MEIKLNLNSWTGTHLVTHQPAVAATLTVGQEVDLVDEAGNRVAGRVERLSGEGGIWVKPNPTTFTWAEGGGVLA